MNRRTFLSTPVLLLAADWAFAQKPRLRRKDSFFGLHFDLHPNRSDTALGRDVTDEMVERLLAKVKPDYVQYDCKGHVGYLGYPSRVSDSAPGIVKDSLGIWRRVTARHGVALYIHFSGVWDSLAVEQHPEWGALRPDGALDGRTTSTFGPYVDERMIPQLKEAAERYDLDGAWVDGECWAVRLDYSPAAAGVFRQATGIQELPRKPNEPGWQEFLELNRAQFRRYVKHYVDALHAFRPAFQIASNWLYSTYVPEKPDLPVDFISGDYLGNASISTARVEARYMASTGKPWDLMAWGFQRAGNQKVGPSDKHAVQLKQEASVVLAQGGGFQVYYQPTRAGKFDDRTIEVMAELARFCRSRQTLSHKSETVPQIGLLFSATSLYRTANKLFGAWGSAMDPARGLLDALVENYYSVDIIPDWKLQEVAGQYPLIVAPEWPHIGAQVRTALAEYLKRGGKLMVAGAENAALFAGELGVRLVGPPAEQDSYITGDEVFGTVRGVWQQVEPAGAKMIEQRYPTHDSTRGGLCAASLSDAGAGKIAAIYGPIGSVFAATHAPATRQFIRRVVERVFTPTVRLEGPPTIEVVLRRKDGKLLVHLANSTAMQVAADYAVSDFVPPVGPLRLQIQAPRKPLRVTLEPEGRVLQGQWKDGLWSASINRLEIHSIVAVTPVP